MRFQKSIFIFLFITITAIAFPSHAALHTKLQFSTDNGKNYSNDFPVVKVGSELLVKVNYEVVNEQRKIKNGVLTTSLFNHETDFASAKTGKQSWDGAPAWYQRLKKYWANAKQAGSFTYRLDLGKRPAGEIGIKNKWDKSTRKFIDAPLPACSALPPGEYKFNLGITYRLAENNKAVTKFSTFYVTILGKNGKISKPSPAKTIKKIIVPANNELPTVTGDYLLKIDKGKAFGKSKPRSYGKLIRSGNDGFAWILSGISDGKYYIRLLVESGSRTGEEQISKSIPFIFLNGKAVHFSRAGKISPYKKIFVAVIESDKPLEIKNGDEIRWNKKRYSCFGSLALAKKKMPMAPVWVNSFHDPDLDDYFRVKGNMNIPLASKKGTFSFSVQNVQGLQDNLSVNCKILDYFQNTVAELEKKLLLQNRKLISEKITFPVTASDRYRAIVTIKDSSGKSYEKVFAALAADLKSVRKKIWLNKGWQWASIVDDKTLKTRTFQPPEYTQKIKKWHKTDLPASWKSNFKNKNHHLAWYRKTFTVPDSFKNERYFIHIARATNEAKIYLNGKLVGDHLKPNGPFDLEITKLLNLNSENHLLIGIRDKVASLVQTELKKKHLELSPAGVVRAPIGMRPGLGEVSLYSSPVTKIEDVFVKTSFRKKSITIETTIPKTAVNQKYSLTHKIYLANKKIYEFKPISALNKQIIKTSGKWNNPPLWGPEKFPLLKLETELRDSTGKLLDRLNTRFGFREFWPEGMALKWNGETVKFGSRPFHSTWSWNIDRHNKRDYIRELIRRGKRLECNMFRHIYNSENFAAIADEEGMLIAQGGAHTMAHHTKQQLDSDEFWNNAVEFAKEMVKGLRNYPSIVEWYLSNEYYGFSEPRNKARLVAYGEEVLKIDDSRIIEFGCDLDLAGYNNIISVHYPVDVGSFRMDDSFLPEAAYWRYFKDKFKPGMKVPGGMCKRVANVHGDSQMTWGSKPIIVNETCWVSFFSPPDGLSRIFSDHVYESPWAVNHAHDLANTWFSRGHRDANVSAVTLWKHLGGNPNWISLPKIDINILQKFNKFYSGQKVVYNVNLTRDIYNSAPLLFSWKLKDDSGKIIDSDSENMQLKPCELKRVTIPLTMPIVDKQRSFSLFATLTENGKVVRSEKMPIRVYPGQKSNSFIYSLFGGKNDIRLNSKISIGFFDATGKTPAKISKIIEKVNLVKKLTKTNLKNLDLLIIGEKQPKGILKDSSNILTSFVENGGKILLLQQNDTQKWLPIKLTTSNRVPAINYTFRPEHPLLKNIVGDELSYWYPNHKVGANYYIKPETGNFKIIVESGGPNGMVYAGMLEILKGKGSFICSQLFLLDDFEKNPVSRKIWKNIISYAATKNIPHTSVGYLGPENSKFTTELKKIRAQFDKISNIQKIFNYRVVILEPHEKLSDTDIKNIRKFIADGGTLLIHNTTPDTIKTVASICNKKVQVSQITAVAWKGRAVRLKYAPEIAGITNGDFFWRSRPETQNYRVCFFSDKTIQEQLGEWQITCSGSEEMCFPSLLSKLKLGKGTVIFDNINWETNNKQVVGNARRIGSTILTNLGIEVKGFKALEVPKKLNYQTVDISSFLNRSFIDDKDFDGKGGWTDQGPDCDLRSFPMNKPVVTLNKVPFRIEKPKSCLVLNSKHRPGAPESVTLPLDLKANVLFFLQSSAWTSAKHHASYIVNYADGTEYSIKLVGGVNLRDWAAHAASDPFLYEIDTITKVAWTGKNKKFGKANLYMMAWLNPQPEKTIKSVTFKSMNIGIPVLVGITAGTEKAKIIRKTSMKKQLAQAVSLNKTGEKLLKEKKLSKAEKSFREAIKTAWDHPASYLNLGYIYEQQEQWDKAIAVYEGLLEAVPTELEAFLRIGKCQEHQGKFKEALNTYRRSLKADINQPDVMKALDEVKKKIEK